MGDKWITERDRNTAFFHAKVNSQRNQQVTRLMLDENTEDWNDDIEIIHSSAVNFFAKQLVEETSTLDFGELVNAIPRLLNKYQNDLIASMPSREEIKEALFSLNPLSVPGPGG